MSGEHGIKGQASSPAPQAPQATSEWKPIESAPKDGTVILIHFKSRAMFAVFPAIWKPSSEKYPWLILEEGGTNRASEKYIDRWMPLPPPPQSQIEEPRSGDDDSQPTQEST